MRKAIFATLALLSVSMAATALAPGANAHTYLFPPNSYEGSNN